MSPVTLDTARLAGLELGPRAVTIDARWLMAYAAALGETDPRYYDTTRAGGPVAHPLFAVCYEWPLALALRARAFDETIAQLGVHATHSLVIHRPPQAGEVLRVSAQVVGARRVRAGTLIVMRFTTTDRSGVAVTTTDHSSVYRGVDLTGDDVTPATSRPNASHSAVPTPRWEAPIDIPLQLAHVYTECARIYNPIHTDAAVALNAGLPGIILHGTATLALAVSRIVGHDLGGDPARVRGVDARFSGMVRLPSRFAVRAYAADDSAIGFDGIGADGATVLKDGRLLCV